VTPGSVIHKFLTLGPKKQNPAGVESGLAFGKRVWSDFYS